MQPSVDTAILTIIVDLQTRATVAEQNLQILTKELEEKNALIESLTNDTSDS